MKVMDVFLEAIDVTREACFSNGQVEPGMTVPPAPSTTVMGNSLSPSSQNTQNPYVGMGFGDEGHIGNPVLAATPFQPVVWPVYSQSWPFLPTKGPIHKFQDLCNEEHKNRSVEKAMISVEDRDLLALYYEKAFENLQQTNCRTLAKAYIKLVEPRKQVNYPYNGRKIVAGTPRQLDHNVTKPPWWPSEVSHREPDHLPKAERIRLLVYILQELRISHGISVAKLKELDQSIRHQLSPPERLHILDEIYQVREQEEQFLDGKTNGQTMASISCANFPETEGTAGHTNISKKRNGDGSSTIPVTFRDTETPIGYAEYASAMDAPQGAFTPSGHFPNLASSYHAVLSQIGKSKPREQILPHQPSFDSTMSVSPRRLKRKRDFVEIHPAKPRSPNALAHYFAPPPGASQFYGPAYPIQSPAVPGTRHSMLGMPEDPFVAYNAPYYIGREIS
ncbi:hypothetical protein PENARI_c033G11454 [Penicillium arizonense]|uniref:Subtelomeric hrmA-associated cluster protein AFUB-079030/YDR124W-like helical bundle domain-containing protein n=1 Tax=Penicillium arizonense TaxID=1835702 RepID=A0A1F5L4W4_PENAI|nr:hypothetical protein PENARI_c033G11454 [Penicillium arizonense]OGE48020.1 hypothetical protein PENARI_c033G11454 [Penicillium arizonense]